MVWAGKEINAEEMIKFEQNKESCYSVINTYENLENKGD
jgi:hypothetical protein